MKRLKLLVLLWGMLFCCVTMAQLPLSSSPVQTPHPIADPEISLIGETCIMLEYESVYDVHTEPDPVNYPNMRSQPAQFDWSRILSDLETVVNPVNYDFVLLYTLREVPGWIKNGYKRYVAAQNIGLPNAGYGAPMFPAWTRLRSICHMNSVDFLDRDNPSFPDLPRYGSSLVAIHEMGHFWLVYITRNLMTGHAGWDLYLYPLGYLASYVPHWMGIWEGDGLPGLMLTGPNGVEFNAWDLYLMGLMGYDQAVAYEYSIKHDGTVYNIDLDDLIGALSEAAPDYYSGDGRRAPDIDPESDSLQTLIAMIKGRDDTLTTRRRDLALNLAMHLPPDWRTATWGRSEMTVGIDLAGAHMNDQTQAGHAYGYWFEKDVWRWQEFAPQLSVLTGLDIYICRNGNPGNLVCEIRTLSDSVLMRKVIDKGCTPVQDWMHVFLGDSIRLNPGDIYRIYVSADSASGSPSNRYFWRGSNESDYNSGCRTSVSETHPDFDFAFRTYGRPAPMQVEADPARKPAQVVLHDNYPNPFNPVTRIRYRLNRASPVRLQVFDIRGRRVALLVDAVQSAGAHEIEFDGRGQASGVYIYRLQTPRTVRTGKMVLAR
ncbi:MAG: T9SS type A sorting domain-containing protein [candidate division KSB1 bacterium]|nr:T9SS type A sorting domain-containing protein [candidate division KSB1 bacterium]